MRKKQAVGGSKKTAKATNSVNPDIVQHYNPFSSWQSVLVRAGELSIDAMTEAHIRFFSTNKNPSRRILGVWDFYQRGGGFGDVLTFLQHLTFLRAKYGLKGDKNIDVCFIDDDTHYNAKKAAFQKPITWKRQMMSLAHFTPYLGTVYYFRSDAEFKRFYTANRKHYYRWPISVSLSQPSTIHYISKQKKETGKVAGFVMPPEVQDDIYSFYEKYVFPSMPVVIHLRRNTRNTSRNTDLVEMTKFINHFKQDDRYKFIIVCMKEEIPPEMRKLKNVFFSKDYFCDIDHDYGFIYSAYIGLYPSSGMANFAWFCDAPLINFGWHTNNPYSAPRKGEFFSEHQKYVHGVEHTDWLIPMFEDLANFLKIHKINNTLAHSGGRKSYDYKF